VAARGGEAPWQPGSRAYRRPRLSVPAMDLLVTGRIRTLDPARPLAEAALARDGRWVRVGTRADCARVARDPHTLEVACAVPGLCDAHGHPVLLGRSLLEVDLRDAGSAAECVARVAERAEAAPGRGWIRGRGWDQNRWPGAAFPTSRELTAAVPDRPALLLRVDGHCGWANDAALRAAGIDDRTPDPPGGRIVRDARGAVAVLVDAALERVLRAVPRSAPDDDDRALAAGLDACARAGLTEVHDAGVGPDVLASYRRLAAAGRLPVRAYVMLDGQVPLDELDRRIAERGPGEQGRLRVHAVKLFADGALGSRGAALLAPYEDEPSTSGLLLLSAADLRERVRRVAAAGLQPAVHAIGDRACREVLRAFAATPGIAALRPRVEHLQLVAPEDLPLLAASGAVASMQPVHATSDGPWVEARIGARRAAGAYAWRAVLDAGAPLALGSDFPVESPDPLAGLAAAEARTPAGWRAPWTGGQRLTRAEALAGFTRGAAWAAFAEDRRGMVREGLDADLTLLGADLLDASAAAVADVPVLGTVVAGTA
jgi:predicted amidohydrolase YtcJ